jgi:hypothetical protein
MSKATKTKVERVNEFHCCDQAMSHTDFIAHITTAHGFVKGTQCRRSLVQALDGAGFYSNVFEWEIPCGDKTVKAQQVSSGPRDDSMWGDE